MKTKFKHKKIMVFGLFALMLLCVFGAFLSTPMTASAATYSSAKYTTYGSYDIGDGSTSGYLDKYKIYMHASSQNGNTGTIYNGKVLNWSYVYIKIDVTDINSHTSFKLTRNGSTYVSKTLSGSSDMTLYSGALPDGEYVLTYKGKHNTFLWVTTDYTYTYRFVIDKTGPTYSLKAGTSTISSGKYTNQQITYSVSDYKTWCIYYKRPNYSSYSKSYNDTYTVAATSANNGWWYFYAEDYYDNTNSVVSIYLDTVAPVGKVTNTSGTTVANGGYTNKPIKYTATDTGGVSYYQYKTPSSSSWQSYTSGTSVGSGYGWYTFRAVDKAGNVSSEYKVYYDAGMPSAMLYGGTNVKASGGYTNASYIKYVATDSYSGIANCYVKMPNSSYYTAYASGTQLATEGTYYFYAVDKSGNQTSVVSITLDKTKPTGTLYGGNSIIASGGSTNANYIKFVPYDAIGLSATYVKKPNSMNYVAYMSGTQFTAEGTYSFYSVDKAGNTSAIYTVTLDRNIPTGQLYVDGSPIQNNRYTNGSHIYFECTETCYVKLPDSDSFVAYASGTEFYKSGKYVFYGVSKAGNNTGYYTIVIDRTIKVPNIVNVKNGVTDGDVTIDWTDGNADEFAPIAKVTVNGKTYTKGSTIYTIDTGVYKVYCVDAAGNEWSGEFRSTKNNIPTKTFQKDFYEAPDKDGKYTVIAVNHAGKSEEFKFVISKDAPKVEMKANTDDKKLEITVTESSDAESHIQTLEIYKSTDNGATWELLSKDDYGNTISLDKLSYAFRTTGKYKVVITDEFRTGIDAVTKEFTYTQAAPEGKLNGVANGGYTNKGVSFEWTDEATVEVKKDGEVITYMSGAILTADGKYTIVFENFDGFQATYEFTIDTIAPLIEIAGGADGKTVTGDVKVILKENNLRAELFKNGESLGEYRSDTVITESGAYTLIVTDLARNVTEAEFTIDKFVDYEANIHNGGLSNGVTVKANEEVMYTMTKDGTEIVYTFGEKITAVGEYVLALTDKFGNTDEIRFTIVDPLVKSFEHNFDEVVGFEKVTVNGEDKRLNYGTLELFDDGVFEVTVYVNGNGYAFTVEVDKTAPSVKLNGVENGGGTKGSVSISDLSEQADMKVYRDGMEIDYKLGDELTEIGQYKIVLTDTVGNVAEYNFEILYSMNGGAIALIVIGILAVLGVVGFVVMKKRRVFKK